MATSLQIKCVEGVQSEIQGLALSGLPSAQVYAKKLPTDRKVTLPCIICSLAPEGERMVGGLNEREDIGWPVLVTFVIAENQDNELDANADLHSVWRQNVMLHFHNKRLPPVTAVHICKVEPRAVIDMEAFTARNLYAGSLLVSCISRNARV